MSWVRLDDKVRGHRKVLKAGLEAFGFWVASLSYAADYQTDGVVPDEALTAVFPSGLSRKRCEALAARLVDVGLWEPVEGGYRIHDYLDWNPSKADLAAERAATAERVKAWREKRRRNPVTAPERNRAVTPLRGEGVTDGVTPPPSHPVPVPVPVPLSGGLLSPPEPPSRRAGFAPPVRRAGGAAKAEAKSAATWHAYAEAYRARYGVEPPRNADVNRDLAKLVDKLGAEDAPAVAAFYVRHNLAWYVQKGHATRWLVADAEKLHTEWKTGRIVTTTEARHADRRATTGQWAAELLAENAARRRQEDPDGRQ